MPNYEDLSLEELFAGADRIGNKYLSLQEQQAFEQEWSQATAKLRKED